MTGILHIFKSGKKVPEWNLFFRLDLLWVWRKFFILLTISCLLSKWSMQTLMMPDMCCMQHNVKRKLKVDGDEVVGCLLYMNELLPFIQFLYLVSAFKGYRTPAASPCSQEQRHKGNPDRLQIRQRQKISHTD